MKLKNLKELIADFPDDARIYQPKRGCSGVLTVKVKGILVATIDVAESGFDRKSHKQKKHNAPAVINQTLSTTFFE